MKYTCLILLLSFVEAIQFIPPQYLAQSQEDEAIKKEEDIKEKVEMINKKTLFDKSGGDEAFVKHSSFDHYLIKKRANCADKHLPT